MNTDPTRSTASFGAMQTELVTAGRVAAANRLDRSSSAHHRVASRPEPVDPMNPVNRLNDLLRYKKTGARNTEDGPDRARRGGRPSAGLVLPWPTPPTG